MIHVFPCRSEAAFCEATARRYARDFYASPATAYRLADGLAEETRVTVRKVDIGYAEVADAAGRLGHVSSSCLERPCWIWWKGNWIDRFTHADGDAAYAAALAYWNAERETRGVLYELAAHRRESEEAR